MLIRPLTTFDECRKAAELERLVWGYTDAEDIIPPPMLIVTTRRGGVLLGAFDEAGEMIGFVYATPALKDGQLTQWSHVLGVTAGARGRGVGAALKLAQRQHALRMGIDVIEWTFDPLQALNAYFNFCKLGVVVEEYEENIYGVSSSVLHQGTPTDRFVAQWNLTTPHVERRIAATALPRSGRAPRPAIGVRDSAVLGAVLVNPSRSSGEWLEPGEPSLEVEGARILVEIPAGFTEMQAREPGLALAWRLATRPIFHAYFARGYRAVDFFLAREHGRGHYLLARAAG